MVVINETELDLKVRDAMHRIEELYHETDGKCFLSFSGGKDSMVILALIKMCEELYTIPKNAIPAIFCDTGVELDATKEFVEWCKENYYSNIEIIKPEKSFGWILENKGKPLRTKMKSSLLERFHRLRATESKEVFEARRVFQTVINKYNENGNRYTYSSLSNKDMHFIHEDFSIKMSDKCCEYLKKEPFRKYRKQNGILGYYTGIRSDEGGVRQLAALNRQRNGEKPCTIVAKREKTIVKMPIIDWSDEIIKEFIRKYNIPMSKVYTEYGLERTGCIGCPFSAQLKESLKALFDFEPNKYRASMFWLKDVYIAQNIKLPFDEEYEKERIQTWRDKYHRMRFEMIEKYRPDSCMYRKYLNGGFDDED